MQALVPRLPGNETASLVLSYAHIVFCITFEVRAPRVDFLSFTTAEEAFSCMNIVLPKANIPTMNSSWEARVGCIFLTIHGMAYTRYTCVDSGARKYLI